MTLHRIFPPPERLHSGGEAEPHRTHHGDYTGGAGFSLLSWWCSSSLVATEEVPPDMWLRTASPLRAPNTPAEKEWFRLNRPAVITREKSFCLSISLPAFYVVVLFLPVEQGSLFLGGKSTDKFVRIVLQHLARHFLDRKSKRACFDMYERALASFIKTKGSDWEVSPSQS
ncbi:hypothetical protein BV898_19893 [Hypsibius exemplaris]|uniref:Tautomerase cis-CaaD-like domain-containing protein n=1 Tax=Hypsibius exemplaris TaxID=2072580 RepID=A0A9X6RPW5_HYPEX|nr:hypothetical protein BV898_19893 [Hypsibius exemplaris]